MSFKKFKKSIRKSRSQAKKSRCDQQECSLEPTNAHKSFSHLFDSSFVILKRSTKNSIKEYFKSLKYHCMHLLSKRNSSGYCYNHLASEGIYDDFKDHTVCASPLLDTCLPLKTMDRALDEMASGDIHLTFDEYVRAVTVSHSAPNQTRFSAISCLANTVSLSLSEKNKALTTSPITPNLMLTNTISRSESIISLSSPLEEMYTFDVSFFEDAKTVTNSSSAPSLTLIDTILRSDSMINLSFQEDEKAITASHPIPNWMPTSNPAYANLTLDILNKALSPLDEVYLYGLSLCGTSKSVTTSQFTLNVVSGPSISCAFKVVNIESKSLLPLKVSYIITTPITVYTNANTIFRTVSGKIPAINLAQTKSVTASCTMPSEDRTGECIPGCEPNAGSELSTSNKRVFGTIRKPFKGIFKRNKYTTQISVAPNFTISVDPKSVSPESEVCSSFKGTKGNNINITSKWDTVGKLLTAYFKKSGTARDDCNRFSQYLVEAKNKETFLAIDVLSAGSQEFKGVNEEIGKEVVKFEEELYVGKLEEFGSSRSQSLLSEIAEAILVDDMYAYKFKSLEPEAEYDIRWQNKFHEKKNNDKAHDGIFLGIANALHSIILHSHSTDKLLSNPVYIKRSLLAASLSGTSACRNPKITSDGVFKYLKLIFGAYDEITIEHSIIGYLYLTRMLSISGQNLTEDNWELLIAVIMLTTIKFWDDRSLYTADFVPLFSGLELKEVRDIERTFLNDIEFHLSVKCKEFAATYFYLKRWI
ncbi:MAG: hypothetical protein EXX96DRAFT_564583 [Benjaminiella poitrasii]|nr:MAG: hypothetical protein EXX96DRAFT_564583 [Benjaminiella poitrasii]